MRKSHQDAMLSSLNSRRSPALPARLWRRAHVCGASARPRCRPHERRAWGSPPPRGLSSRRAGFSPAPGPAPSPGPAPGPPCSKIRPPRSGLPWIALHGPPRVNCTASRSSAAESMRRPAAEPFLHADCRSPRGREVRVAQKASRSSLRSPEGGRPTAHPGLPAHHPRAAAAAAAAALPDRPTGPHCAGAAGLRAGVLGAIRTEGGPGLGGGRGRWAGPAVPAVHAGPLRAPGIGQPKRRHVGTRQ